MLRCSLNPGFALDYSVGKRRHHVRQPTVANPWLAITGHIGPRLIVPGSDPRSVSDPLESDDRLLAGWRAGLGSPPVRIKNGGL